MINLVGWSCPICSNVFAPFVTECRYCNVLNVSISNKETYILEHDESSTAEYPYKIVYLPPKKELKEKT